jgi:alkanesulfonate monooxygenase SsuD/methylene tetrahydromethanopterin reductase-like flavin-dependent oxidoreductase (luciferase family)
MSRLQRGLFVAPFDELSDPSLLVTLAEEAEEHAWDGLFLWDHIKYRPPVQAIADPWVALSAIAARTAQVSSQSARAATAHRTLPLSVPPTEPPMSE